MLALVGSGEYLPGMDEVDRTLLGRLTETARVVCIPAAAGTEGDAMIDSWLNRGVAHFTKLGVETHGVRVHNRATAENLDFADQIKQANFVYLSGGKPSYLYNLMHDTPVWNAILDVHHKGGVVAGCSAGAMIMGTQFMYGGTTDAFDLVPNSVIIPHFDEFPGFLSRIMRAFQSSNRTMYGIDGYTALVVDPTKPHYEVLGSGGVTVITKSDRTRYISGDTIQSKI